MSSVKLFSCEPSLWRLCSGSPFPLCLLRGRKQGSVCGELHCTDTYFPWPELGAHEPWPWLCYVSGSLVGNGPQFPICVVVGGGSQSLFRLKRYDLRRRSGKLSLILPSPAQPCPTRSQASS